MNDKSNKMDGWKDFCQKFTVGSLIRGTVKSTHHFGVFLDVQNPSVNALLELGEVFDNPTYPIALPHVGENLLCRIIQINDKSREIILSIRPSVVNKI